MKCIFKKHSRGGAPKVAEGLKEVCQVKVKCKGTKEGNGLRLIRIQVNHSVSNMTYPCTRLLYSLMLSSASTYVDVFEEDEVELSTEELLDRRN